MTDTTARHDVAIVGYGPTGEALAGLLGSLGVDVVVLEREPGVHHLPRAAHLDDEIMRVIQTLGAHNDVTAAVTELRGMHLLRADGVPLLAFDAPPGVGEQGWPAGYMFHQPELEASLRRAAQRHRSVQVQLSTEVLAVDARDDHVRLSVRDPDGDRSIEADWVVGCDGGRSMVRQAIGSGHDDLGLHQPWLVIDALLRRPLDLPEVCIQHCDPARPATFIPMPGRRRRWEFMLLDGEDPDEMPARAMELLAPWGGPEDLEVERATTYTFHALVAQRWRRDRLLIAGDAAHQMPPFLGQGACSGIRDAANLAWKLALVANDRADVALLDTYQSERSPHVRAIIETAVSMGAIIQTTDRAAAAARDEAFAGGAMPPPPRRPALGPGLHVGDGPQVGALAPQPHTVAADGTVTDRLDDQVGYRWALLGSLATSDPADVEAWTAMGAVVVPTAGAMGEEIRAWLEANDATAALVRPDRYLHWIGSGALPPPPAALKTTVASD